jgi:hypothetical protein
MEGSGSELIIADPDPGGPKTYRYGSRVGSGTLEDLIKKRGFYPHPSLLYSKTVIALTVQIKYDSLHTNKLYPAFIDFNDCVLG